MNEYACRPNGLRRLAARKPLAAFFAEANCEEGKHFRREFGPINLMLLGIGTIVGGGIFIITGQIAATVAGPAIAISFLIAGFACGCAAFCYAELASMVPVAGGSAYTYTYVTLGELAAWIIAWDVIAEYLFSTAGIAVGWSGYFEALLSAFQIHLQPTLSSAPFDFADNRLVTNGSLFNFPAALLVLAAGAVVSSGTRSVARLSGIFIAIKLCAVILFIAFGFANLDPHNWSPFIPPPIIVNGSARFGWHGVISGAALIFFTYLGFDTIATAGQETRNPRRALPIAILGSVGICTLLYVGMALTLTGLVKYPALAVPAPVHAALAAHGRSLAWLDTFVGWSAVIGLASAALALLFGLSRVLFALAQDGLLPFAFARVTRRAGVPSISVACATLGGAILAGLCPIMLLGQLISVGTLMAFAVVCGSLAYLRATQPQAPRAFRVPCWPVVSGTGVVSCVYLLGNIGTVGLARLAIWMIAGLIIYFGYSLRSHHGWSLK